MDTRERAELFTRYAGLELKGKITSRGFTAKEVAEATGRSAAAFNRWLNGKVDLPLTVLCQSCEIIDVTPASVVEAAYARLLEEAPADRAESVGGDVGPVSDTESLPRAAKRGRRKGEIDPAE